MEAPACLICSFGANSSRSGCLLNPFKTPRILVLLMSTSLICTSRAFHLWDRLSRGQASIKLSMQPRVISTDHPASRPHLGLQVCTSMPGLYRLALCLGLSVLVYTWPSLSPFSVLSLALQSHQV